MKFERLAALGALGVCGGVSVVYLALVWIGHATAVAGTPGATGGIDHISRNVLWIAALVPVSLFIIGHLAMAKQLLRGSSTLTE
jgi:uncharacterized membrane protein